MLRTDSLGGLLEDALATGLNRIAQVLILRQEEGFSLLHTDDAGRPDLQIFHSPTDAQEIARHNDRGDYRPLKSAPDLRHGWRLELSSLEEVRLALDAIYPAALGTWRALLRKESLSVPLEATLGRQTGMYKVAAQLTATQASGIVGELCKAGCLKCPLWPVTEQEAPSVVRFPEDRIPLLCGEACHLFITTARNVVTGSGSARNR